MIIEKYITFKDIGQNGGYKCQDRTDVRKWHFRVERKEGNHTNGRQ